MRGRLVGGASKRLLTNDETKQVFSFLEKKTEIKEIILSGGDPLTCPKDYLTQIIDGLVKLQKNNKIEIIRIATRLPIHSPCSLQDWHYELLATIKNLYLFIHINHPVEITQETVAVVDNFRKQSSALILGQSVLLKGVNDDINTLCDLFSKMIKTGIIPYCLYQNDPVPWAEHFIVPIKEAVQLWQKVRPRLSGLAATAKFIIEPVGGIGKIPVPESGAWDVDYSHFYDFNKKSCLLKL